jgi:hypothetical protein
MLVRFLSYAASVIGARRYKPLVLSCLAIILSVTTIGVVATTLSSSPQDTPNRTTQDATGTHTTKSSQQNTNQLGGLDKKTPKDTANAGQTPPQPSDQGGTSGSPKTGSNATPEPATLEINVNASTVSLSKTNPAASVMVTTTSSAVIQWNITAETTVPGLTARIESAKDDMGNATARFNLDSTTPEGTYQFTITGKDAAHNLSASQTITVTIN